MKEDDEEERTATWIEEEEVAETEAECAEQDNAAAEEADIE